MLLLRNSEMTSVDKAVRNARVHVESVDKKKDTGRNEKKSNARTHE